jgi:ABC-type nitrate/sulfonate/bicarbonate transport system substrate-binding protein
MVQIAAFVILLCLSISQHEVAAADRVKLALPSKSMGYLPLFIAINRGVFKEEGIDLEVVMMLPEIAHTALFREGTRWPP